MDQAHALLTYFSGPMGYVFFYFLVTACGCGFPFNSDLTLIAAAVLAASGYFNLQILLILAFLAILTGDSITFFIARKWGPGLIRIRPFRWIITEKNFKKAEDSLCKHGHPFLFIVRFLPLVRTPLFFAAGTLQVSPQKFYLMNGLATLIYVPTLMIMSYLTSTNIDLVIQLLKKFQWGLFGFSIFAVIIWFSIKKQPKAGDQQ